MRSGRVWILVVLTVLAVGACSTQTAGHQDFAGKPTHRSAPTHPRSTHAKPARPRHHATQRVRHRARPKPLQVNPLTGLKPVPKGPVVGVKIDESPNARPQTNVNAADVVYVEQVEAGETRLLAMYAGHHPSTVGPVRSARYNDLDMLAQYGRVGLAFSGSAAAVLNTIRHANVVESSAVTDTGAYVRTSRNVPPYNLMLQFPSLLPHLTHAARVKDVGFRWAPTDRRFRRTVHSFTTRIGLTTVGFRWDAHRHRWIRQIDGATAHQSDGQPEQTPNVIIQSCKVRKDARDVDVDGNPSAYTETVGKGRAIVFSGGKMVDGTWSRSSKSAGTHYRDGSGKDITLRRGGVWVLLVARGAPVTMH